MKELIAFRKYLTEGVINENINLDDKIDTLEDFKVWLKSDEIKNIIDDIAEPNPDHSAESIINQVNLSDFSDGLSKKDWINDMIQNADTMFDFGIDTGEGPSPKEIKYNELYDKMKERAIEKYNIDLDSWALGEGVIDGEGEEDKEDVDSMEDLEDNSDYQEAVYSIIDDAVGNASTNLAKEMGYDSYQSYIEDVGDESDSYKEEFMPLARENAEIDYKILDQELRQFLRWNNVTFEVDLRRKMFDDAQKGFSDYA